MFALVDGNCFFVSCERVLKPWLNGVAVGVLSNNDGCIIARSKELKELGIPMGAPLFKYQSMIEKNNGVLFSSNFPLYVNLSQRMMNILKQHSPAIEVYSIDEAFIDLTGLNETALKRYAIEIQSKIKRWIGIPVGIGIAPTKTLAKIANKLAKNMGDSHHLKSQIHVLMNQRQIDIALKNFPIAEVWGIGKMLSKKLIAMQINTAKEFANMPIQQVEKNFTLNEVKIHLELNGTSTLKLISPKLKKSIRTARSFGKKIRDKNLLSEALSNFVACSTAKLRKQNSLTRKITVFLQISSFKSSYTNQKNYFVKEKMIKASDDVRFLNKIANQLLEEIYQSDKEYEKVGVIFSHMIEKKNYSNLYQDNKAMKLMSTFDLINNRYGHGSIKVAKQGLIKKRDWQMKQNYPSQSTKEKVQILF